MSGDVPSGERPSGESPPATDLSELDIDLEALPPLEVPADEEPTAVVPFDPDGETDLIALVEALLLLVDEPLTPREVQRRLADYELDEGRIRQAFEVVLARHDPRQTGRGLVVNRVAGGYQLRTHPSLGEAVAAFTGRRPVRLSRAALETLAIIAYRQPITRGEVEKIRGVETGGVIRSLLDRGLLEIRGRKKEVGRPMIFGTSAHFLSTFGLRDLADLPNLREFQRLAEDGGLATQLQLRGMSAGDGQAEGKDP